MHGGSKTDGLCDSNPPLPHKTNSYTSLGGESNRLRGAKSASQDPGKELGGGGCGSFSLKTISGYHLRCSTDQVHAKAAIRS
jgi:hypothetical protein